MNRKKIVIIFQLEHEDDRRALQKLTDIAERTGYSYRQIIADALVQYQEKKQTAVPADGSQENEPIEARISQCIAKQIPEALTRFFAENRSVVPGSLQATGNVNPSDTQMTIASPADNDQELQAEEMTLSGNIDWDYFSGT